jgi:SAM-dependent methyltransferase
MSDNSIVEAGYDAVHAAMPRSPTLLRIWRQHAMGEDFPEAFWHISFLTLEEAGRIVEDLGIATGATLVDLGCGTGSPGLYIARETGANLIGVDLSGVAIGVAAGRADALGLAATSRFQKGSFDSTGLPGGYADAAVSFDALQYAPDKAAAFTEAARALRPGGRLAFTAFELHPERAGELPVLGDDPVDDYREVLATAGLLVTRYEETASWEGRMTAAYSAILEAKEALTEEMGSVAATALMSEVTVTLERRPYTGRVLCVAQRL